MKFTHGPRFSASSAPPPSAAASLYAVLGAAGFRSVSESEAREQTKVVLPGIENQNHSHVVVEGVLHHVRDGTHPLLRDEHINCLEGHGVTEALLLG